MGSPFPSISRRRRPRSRFGRSESTSNRKRSELSSAPMTRPTRGSRIRARLRSERHVSAPTQRRLDSVSSERGEGRFPCWISDIGIENGRTPRVGHSEPSGARTRTGENCPAPRRTELRLAPRRDAEARSRTSSQTPAASRHLRRAHPPRSAPRHVPRTSARSLPIVDCGQGRNARLRSENHEVAQWDRTVGALTSARGRRSTPPREPRSGGISYILPLDRVVPWAR